MAVHNHAVVWVDHHVAKIFYMGLDAVDERTIHADLANALSAPQGQYYR